MTPQEEIAVRRSEIAAKRAIVESNRQAVQEQQSNFNKVMNTYNSQTYQRQFSGIQGVQQKKQISSQLSATRADIQTSENVVKSQEAEVQADENAVNQYERDIADYEQAKKMFEEGAPSYTLTKSQQKVYRELKGERQAQIENSLAKIKEGLYSDTQQSFALSGDDKTESKLREILTKYQSGNITQEQANTQLTDTLNADTNVKSALGRIPPINVTGVSRAPNLPTRQQTQVLNIIKSGGTDITKMQLPKDSPWYTPSGFFREVEETERMFEKGAEMAGQYITSGLKKVGGGSIYFTTPEIVVPQRVTTGGGSQSQIIFPATSQSVAESTGSAFPTIFEAAQYIGPQAIGFGLLHGLGDISRSTRTKGVEQWGYIGSAGLNFVIVGAEILGLAKGRLRPREQAKTEGKAGEEIKLREGEIKTGELTVIKTPPTVKPRISWWEDFGALEKGPSVRDTVGGYAERFFDRTRPLLTGIGDAFTIATQGTYVRARVKITEYGDWIKLKGRPVLEGVSLTAGQGLYDIVLAKRYVTSGISPYAKKVGNVLVSPGRFFNREVMPIFPAAGRDINLFWKETQLQYSGVKSFGLTQYRTAVSDFQLFGKNIKSMLGKKVTIPGPYVNRIWSPESISISPKIASPIPGRGMLFAEFKSDFYNLGRNIAGKYNAARTATKGFGPAFVRGAWEESLLWASEAGSVASRPFKIVSRPVVSFTKETVSALGTISRAKATTNIGSPFVSLAKQTGEGLRTVSFSTYRTIFPYGGRKTMIRVGSIVSGVVGKVAPIIGKPGQIFGKYTGRVIARQVEQQRVLDIFAGKTSAPSFVFDYELPKSKVKTIKDISPSPTVSGSEVSSGGGTVLLAQTMQEGEYYGLGKYERTQEFAPLLKMKVSGPSNRPEEMFKLVTLESQTTPPREDFMFKTNVSNYFETPTTNTGVLDLEKFREGEGVGQPSIPRLGERLRDLEKIEEKSKQVTEQKQNKRQEEKQGVRLRLPSINEGGYNPDVVRKALGKMSKGYKTFVFRRGKKEYIGGVRARKEAIKAGEGIVLSGAEARFGIEATKSFVPDLKEAYTPSPQIFRTYLIRKNRRIALKDEWIQKTTQEYGLKKGRLAARTEVRSLISSRKKRSKLKIW